MSIKQFSTQIIVLIVIGWVICGCSSNEYNPFIWEEHPFESHQLIGHRGDCSNAPENTLPSFEYAVNILGLKWIECDPILTKDSIIVLNHGKTIDDHSNSTGKIEEMTYDELSKIDFGHPQRFGDRFAGTKICTADEVIQFAKKHNVIVEFDFSHFDATPRKVKLLYDTVERYNYLDHTVFDPYHVEDFEMVSELTTDVAVCCFTLDTNLVIPSELYKFKNVFIDLNLRKIGESRAIPERIHELGFKAITELINPAPDNPVEKLRFLLESGFDYIYTEGISRSVIEE